MDIERDSYAVITSPADINFGPDWYPDWGNIVTIKVEVTNNHPDKGVSMGIARDQDMTAYLEGVAYDEIGEFHIHHPFSEPRISYRRHPGSLEPASPTSQTFWTTSAYGEETQTLKWGLEEGRYSIVLMNQDGSSSLNISGSIGVKIPMLSGLSIGLLIGGFLLVIMAFLIIYFTVTRTSLSPPTPDSAQP